MSSDALAFAFSVEGLWTKSPKQHILDMFCNPICLFDWCQELISKSVSRLRFLWGGFVAYSKTNSKCMPRKYYPLPVRSHLIKTCGFTRLLIGQIGTTRPPSLFNRGKCTHQVWMPDVVSLRWLAWRGSGLLIDQDASFPQGFCKLTWIGFHPPLSLS